MNRALYERLQAEEDRAYVRRLNGEISAEEYQRILVKCETRFERVNFHLEVSRRLKKGV